VWSQGTLDNPVAIAAPLDGRSYAVASLDGVVATYDRIGKILWSVRLTTRARAVATTLDGAWTVAGSYPEAVMANARGRAQWVVNLEESWPRADFTAVAVAPDGSWTVAATRRGEVMGIDLTGKTLFTVGKEDADDKREGWQSRFGPINAIVLPVQLAGEEAPVWSAPFAVAGGELETVAISPEGQEIWTNRELKAVTCLAGSLDNELSVAVGSRAGFVALLNKEGKTLWTKRTGGYVMSVCFLGRGQAVLAACLDGTLTCYDARGEVLWQRTSPVGFRSVASSYTGTVVAAAELAGKVTLLDEVGEPFAETPPLDGVVRAIALSADGVNLLVGTSANRLYFFRYKRPRPEADEL
jgi:WD40 repeat protein